MSEFIRKAIQKSLLLKKKPHLAPKATPVTDPANWEDAKSKLREILRANGGKPGPWLDDNGQMRLLTRRWVGMKRLKEFRYDAPTPQEERRGLLRTGLLAGGIAAAGGLAGLGLYKSGLSSYARRADRLEKLVKKIHGQRTNLGQKARDAAASRGAAKQSAQDASIFSQGLREKRQAAAAAVAAKAAQASEAANVAAAKKFNKTATAYYDPASAANKRVAREASVAAKKKAPVSAPSVPKTEIPEEVFSAVPEAPIKKAAAAPTEKFSSWAQAKGAFNKGKITKEQLDSMKFSSAEVPKEFDFQNDEGGIPLTGRVARDRFVKKIRDEDLDRRDANILRAGGAGALAGLMFRGGLSRGKRALIGAGAGGLGVIGIRALTNNDRDIYGERNRGSKRAELIPAVGGLGAAAWLGMRRFKGLSSKLRGTKFFEKRERREKRELNPYVGAALSGGVSGASLGALSWLKRGTSVASAGATAAKLGALSAGIVGGGALIGSRIVGDPRKEEGAPFTKRAALGGAISGALVGGAGGLLLRNTKFMKDAAKTWRPAKWMTDAPALGAGALGALGGAVIGGAQGADEGQQVDSIRNIRKDIKQKNFSLREFRALPAVAVKQVWKTDPALRADFAKRVVAKVRAAVAANNKQYGVKEFQVSPLNVESMAKTKERRASERANFLKGIGVAAAVGLAGVGGYRVGRVISKVDINAAKRAAEAASEEAGWQKRSAERWRKSWQDEASSASRARQEARASSWREENRKWEEDFRNKWGNPQGSSGASSSGHDSDYAKRSADAAKKWRQEQSRSSASSSSYRAESGTGSKDYTPPPRSRAKGTGEDRNPHVGTAKEDAWEKWRAMDRMAKESKNEGERETAARMRDMWKKKHNLARKLRGLKLFGRDDQPRYRESKVWADPVMGWIRGDDLVDKDGNKWSPTSPQLVNAMHNKARGIRVNVQRGAGLAGDTSAVLQGKERERDASGRVKKREWEKAWFRNALTTAGLTATGLAGAAAWRYGRMNPGTGFGKFVANTERGVRKTKDDIKSGLGRIMGAADEVTGPAKFIRKLLSAKLKLREFDLFASAAGWDTRDPRGRSVRVYAPGSRPRNRREKYWHEKTENQRKLMIAAGVGAAAIGGLGGVAAYRLAKGKSLVPSFMLKKPQPQVQAPLPAAARWEKNSKGKFVPKPRGVEGKVNPHFKGDAPLTPEEIARQQRKWRDMANPNNAA